MTLFQSSIIAGFDSSRIEWRGNACMLTETRHTPLTDMDLHYTIAQRHGIFTVRDALPWWLPRRPRLLAAQRHQMQVIWDLNHYWRHPAPLDYARTLLHILQRLEWDDEFWCCFNEVSFHPAMCPGQSSQEVADEARAILDVLREGGVNVRLITSEPCHSLAEIENQSWLANEADVIGLCMYPHAMRWTITEALQQAWSAFPNKPIMIAETGLHRNHPVRYDGINDKGEWLDRVLREVHDSMVSVAGICVYPFKSMTWNEGQCWDNGLIGYDGMLDLSLSTAILEANG